MEREEKEIIEYLKGKFECFEEDDTLAKWDYEAINTMLGLIDRLQKENEALKKEIDNLIKENHKHIDYIASMKKKQEDKIKELADGRNYIIVNGEVISIQTLLDFLELLGDE